MAGDVAERRIVTLLLLLSVTTGLIDAVSVLGLGKVFTANMTGNIVFLAFALAGIPGFSWVTCAVALACFTGGAGLAARIGIAHRDRSRRRWLMVIAIGETALLWAAAAVGWNAQQGPTGLSQLLMVALTAVAMGARNATVRQLKVPDLTTTVLTLTITGLAADSSPAGGSNANVGRRVAAVSAILIGAVIGSLLWKFAGVSVPLVLAGVIVLAGTLVLAKPGA
jgi:uncharacterized membrane protein YoaK (UPF0700 family)